MTPVAWFLSEFPVLSQTPRGSTKTSAFKLIQISPQKGEKRQERRPTPGIEPRGILFRTTRHTTMPRAAGCCCLLFVFVPAVR